MTLHVGWVKWWLIAKWTVTIGMMVLVPLASWLHWQSRRVQQQRWRGRQDKRAAQALAAEMLRKRWAEEHQPKEWEQQ